MMLRNTGGGTGFRQIFAVPLAPTEMAILELGKEANNQRGEGLRYGGGWVKVEITAPLNHTGVGINIDHYWGGGILNPEYIMPRVVYAKAY